MSFAKDTGYIPASFSELMSFVRVGVNTQFSTSYTEETFLGTNYYKFFYTLIQRLQQNEIKTAEIFQRLQEYFNVTNEKLSRPNTTAPGIYDYFKSKGYFASIKPPLDADAGKLYICVDVDDTDPDYDSILKPAIAGYVKDCCVGGVISQGTEVESLTLDNNQSFDFKFYLPDKIPVLLRLTLVGSANNEFSVESPEWIKDRLLENLSARYRLGMNFEPQRYFSIIDAPWAGEILLEWSDDDGETWEDGIEALDFDEVFTFTLEDISVVET